jgi:hypothetical protein
LSALSAIVFFAPGRRSLGFPTIQLSSVILPVSFGELRSVTTALVNSFTSTEVLRETAADRGMIERIVIETETPCDARTMSRVLMDNLVIGQNLTAAQAI